MRLYARTLGSSLIAILVLAIGVAFVGAFLSLYVDLVLRPYPGFQQSSRLSTVGQTSGADLIYLPYEVVERLADEMTTIDAAAAWMGAATLVGPDHEEAAAGMVSDQFFSGLRPRLALGRGFRPEDHAADAAPVVVLSYRYWQRRFGGDPDVLGTSLEIARNPSMRYQGAGLFSAAEPAQDSAEFRIVGVVDRSLRGFPTGDGSVYEPAIWVPLRPAWPLFRGVPERLPTTLSAIYVRRAPGVTSTAVANELRARYGAPGAIPNRAQGTQLDAIDGIVYSMGTLRETKRQLEIFLAGSVLLTLVAAANLSLFLLARAPGRRRELGIRMAVGASIRRLARQLATEAGLLVVVSAALGLLMSAWLSLYLRSLTFMRDANWTNVTLFDWRVLALAGVFLLTLTLLVSLAPIFGFKRLAIGESTRQVATRASFAQRLAGTAQIALATTFGAAAIAFGWYLGLQTFGDPGYKVMDRYLVEFGRFRSADSGIEDPLQRNRVEHARRHDVIAAIPGVMAVAFGDPMPGYSYSTAGIASLPDPADSARTIDVNVGAIEPAFIGLLGLTLLHGRAPDVYEPGVVVVNQTLARRLFGRDDAVGERLPGDGVWLGTDGAEVAGVLKDLSFQHPAADPLPYVFLPMTSQLALVETPLTAGELEQALERMIEDGVLEALVLQVEPLETLRSELIAPDRARGWLTIATATLVVLLAAFGYYGTQNYLVAVGRREYAIRASLGAGPTALGRLVLWRGILMSLPGLALGAPVAFVAVAWLRGDYLSLAVSPALVTIAVIVSLMTLLLGATVGPAREAKRTQPADLLRED